MRHTFPAPPFVSDCLYPEGGCYELHSTLSRPADVGVGAADWLFLCGSDCSNSHARLTDRDIYVVILANNKNAAVAELVEPVVRMLLGEI